MYPFETYKDRRIEFKKPIAVWDWKVKIYTITNKQIFEAQNTLEEVLLQLPNWLNEAAKSILPTYNQAFLIVHEAREGTWILLNWWTGGEMIETKVFFAEVETPKAIKPSPHKNSLLCVWELQVLSHEREAWIRHVLSNAEIPAYEHYLTDYLKSPSV